MTRDYNNVHQFFPQYDSNHNYDTILFFTNFDCLWVHRSVQMASDKYKACIFFPWSCPTSLHCLQVAITTPERWSWGYPYIKIYPCGQPTQPRKGWPYHQSLHPARIFSNSGVGPFMSHKNQTGESAVRQDWPMVFCLTICRCHFKDSTFFSVI